MMAVVTNAIFNYVKEQPGDCRNVMPYAVGERDGRLHLGALRVRSFPPYLEGEPPVGGGQMHGPLGP